MATMKTLNGYGFNATELNGKSPEYYIQPRNLLDNSDFRNPVNQRGKTSYTGTGYTIDRWLIISGSCTIENGNGVIVSSPDGTKMIFMQHFENIDVEKVHTFAIKDSDGNVYLIQSTPGERIEENTSFGTIIAKTLPDDITFAITISAANSKKFIWAALYEGAYTVDTLPPYVPKGYAAELAECLRYFRKGAQAVTIGTQYNSGSFFSLSVPIMRIKPTVTLIEISSQGWGDVTASNYTLGWNEVFGSSFYANYIGSVSDDVGKTVVVLYEMSADS